MIDISEDLTGPIFSGGKQHSGSDKSYGGSMSDPARSIKGSQLPDSLRGSMRSYKGSKNGNSGSVVLGPDGEVMSIGGGVGSVADTGSTIADATDNLQGIWVQPFNFDLISFNILFWLQRDFSVLKSILHLEVSYNKIIIHMCR